MSFSRTEQITINSREAKTPLVLKLTSENLTEEKIEALLKTLQKMDVFKTEENEKLINISKNFSVKRLNEGLLNQAHLKMLADLSLQVIRPTLLFEASDEALFQLVVLDDQIKVMMKSYLPVNMPPEQYLEKIDAENEAERVKNIKIGKTAQPMVIEAAGKRLSSLIQKMEISGLFLENEILQIDQWKKEFPTHFFDNLENEELKEMASIALCYLLCKIIHPKLVHSHEQQALSQLIAFEKELKVLIGLSLPTGETIETFVASFNRFANEELLFKQKIATIHALFDEAIDALYANANQLDLKIIANFEIVKIKLLGLSQQQIAHASQANNSVEVLARKIDQLLKSLAKDSNDSVAMSNRLEQCETQFHRLIRDCQSMLQGFKI